MTGVVDEQGGDKAEALDADLWIDVLSSITKIKGGGKGKNNIYGVPIKPLLPRTRVVVDEGRARLAKHFAQSPDGELARDGIGVAQCLFELWDHVHEGVWSRLVQLDDNVVRNLGRCDFGRRPIQVTRVHILEEASNVALELFGRVAHEITSQELSDG